MSGKILVRSSSEYNALERVSFQLPGLYESFDERDVMRALCEASLADFVREAWHVIEPGVPINWNWHIEAVCEHLQAVTDGHIRNLIINIPPGHAKSLLVAVFWPAWAWLKKPSWKGIFTSYADDLTVRDSTKCRRLIESDWYQTTFQPAWILDPSQNAKDFFQNTDTGARMSFSVNGGATGWRGDAIVCDDALKAGDSISKLKRDHVNQWWGKSMSSRLNDMRTGQKVVIMQRLHEEDLTGYLLQHGGYEHLCLPSQFEPKRRSVTRYQTGARKGEILWADPRKEDGELLFPEMFPQEVLDEARKPTNMGADGFAGQHQQRPAPAEGLVFKRGWWRYWRRANEPKREGIESDVIDPNNRGEFDEILMSWDMAFKGNDTSDYVCGIVVGRRGAKRYVLARIRAKLTFTETVKEFKRLCALYPKASRKLIEDKANGTAVVDTLSGIITGIIAVTPEGGKDSRAAATSGQVEAGNWYLPQEAPWLDEFIEEFANFPKGKHDDQVDAVTQCAVYLNASPDAMRFAMLAGR